MSIEKFARRELEITGWFKEDGMYDGMIGPSVMRLIEVFAAEGHSGLSANIAISLFERVARQEPLSPLSGEDHEWNEVEPGLYQNNRCSHVFKKDGCAYDINGRIFRRSNGVTYTNRDSHVDVEFPYTPCCVWVDVDE